MYNYVFVIGKFVQRLSDMYCAIYDSQNHGWTKINRLFVYSITSEHLGFYELIFCMLTIYRTPTICQHSIYTECVQCHLTFNTVSSSSPVQRSVMAELERLH